MARDLEGAYELYVHGYSAYPRSTEFALNSYRVAKKLGRDEAATGHLNAYLENTPNSAKDHMKRCRVLQRISWAQARDAAEIGLQKFPEDDELSDYFRIAKLMTGDLEERAKIDIDHELEERVLPQFVLSNILAEDWRFTDPKVSAGRFVKFANAYPGPTTRKFALRFLLTHGEYQAAWDLIESVSEDARTTDDQRKLAICLAHFGENAAAEEELMRAVLESKDPFDRLRVATSFANESADVSIAAKILARAHHSYPNSGIEGVVEFLGHILPPKRALLGENPDDIQACKISECGPSKAVVVTFGAYGRVVGSPLSLQDRFFAGHGVSLCEVLDVGGTLFMKGIPGLGDTIEEAATNLFARLRDAGFEKIYVTGSSGAGFGTIVYGPRLNARRIVTFSAATDLRQEFLDTVKETRAKSTIQALHHRLGEDKLSVMNWVEAEQVKTPVHAYYCKELTLDGAQAANLKAFPSAEIIPVPRFKTHTSFVAAMGTGQLLTEFTSIAEDANGTT
ncbi:MAG: hypothetical protein AAGJ34_06020 [Pseudomonadota bacterium]